MGRYTLEIMNGERAERLFKATAEVEGYSVTKSSKYINMAEHIDFYLKSMSGLYDFSVDVKSRKKSERSSHWYADQEVWVEFHNVKGADGWLYGEADKIAFERNNDFVIVPREALAKLCEKIVIPRFVHTAGEALYHIYQRKGRKDVISKILMTDIIKEIENIMYWNKIDEEVQPPAKKTDNKKK